MIIRCFDFETTGIPSADDAHAVVEVGICNLHVDDADESHVVTIEAPRSALCNPGRPIPHEAMAVHHITDAMVADATGNAQFFAFAGEVDYFAAHNADYEAQFYPVHGPLICTWKVALRVWPDEPAHNLQFLRYRLGLPVEDGFADPPHRAGPDAYLCALLLARILEEKRCTLDDMVRWSSGRALLPRCPLTKHKGKKWEDVPWDYLNWIVNKAEEMDPNVRANAKLEMRKREEATP